MQSAKAQEQLLREHLQQITLLLKAVQDAEQTEPHTLLLFEVGVVVPCLSPCVSCERVGRSPEYGIVTRSTRSAVLSFLIERGIRGPYTLRIVFLNIARNCYLIWWVDAKLSGTLIW